MPCRISFAAPFRNRRTSTPSPRRSARRSICLESLVRDDCTADFCWRWASVSWPGWMLRRTAAGFRLIAAGESPSAASSAGGIDVMAHDDARLSREWRAGRIGGWRRGSRRHLRSLREHLAGLRIHGDRGRACWRGSIHGESWRRRCCSAALEAGAGAMQRDAGVPSTLVTVIEAALILAVVAVRSATAPTSLPDTATSPIAA